MDSPALVWTALLAAVGLATTVFFLSQADPARSAFPGRNGKIVFTGQSNIWALESDGKRTQLTNRGGAAQPAVSADGSLIVYSQDLNLTVMGIDGSNPRTITDPPSGQIDSDPEFSPDGRHIVFSHHDGSDWDIWFVNVDGSGLKPLVNNSGFTDFDPTWSPDGKTIAFASNQGDPANTEVYAIGTDGTNLRNLTNDPADQDRYPDFSPDGSKIAFVSNRATGMVSNNDIFVMSAAGGPATKLSDGVSTDEEPAFSPDGAFIAFNSRRDNPSLPIDELYVMTANGEQETRLTTTGGNVGPDWQPAPHTTAPTPTPTPSGCVNFRPGIRGKRLGPATLGRTRAAHRKLFRGAKLRARPGIDSYCIAGGGSLRIGYPNKRLNRILGRSLRRKLKDRAVLILTTSKRYSLRGIRPGTSVKKARKQLRRARRIRIGRNTWYVLRSGSTRSLFRSQKGKVREIGLGDKRPGRTKRTLKSYLRAWELGGR